MTWLEARHHSSRHHKWNSNSQQICIRNTQELSFASPVVGAGRVESTASANSQTFSTARNDISQAISTAFANVRFLQLPLSSVLLQMRP